LGIQNGVGHGDVCENHESEEQPYCYVDKNSCTAEGIEWFESSSNAIDTSSIGWSYDVCMCNPKSFFPIPKSYYPNKFGETFPN
jgi:hypothetical protein